MASKLAKIFAGTLRRGSGITGSGGAAEVAPVVVGPFCGSDALICRPPRAFGAGFDNRAIGFRKVGTYAGVVGQAAYLTTSTAAGDQFVHTTANSYVTNSLPNSIIYVVGFSNVLVTAGGANSIADLFDSLGNDTFSEVAPATVAPLDVVHHVVTDGGLPASFAEHFARRGVPITIA